MPGKHLPGYQDDYKRAERGAIRRLKRAHRDEYDRYLAEERAKEPQR